MDNARLDVLFNKARNQAPKTSFEYTKNVFTNSITNVSFLSKLKSFILTKKLLIMMLSGVILSSCLIFLNLSGTKNLNTIKDKNNAVEPSVFSIEKIEKVKSKKAHLKSKNKINQPLIINHIIYEKNKSDEQIVLEEYKISKPNNKITKLKDEELFPVLTHKEKEITNKQKKKMLKELLKFDKKKYAFIPSATTSINKKDVSINAFYMQKFEVTVFEYRTFLFDLLIQNRKEEFLIAKPDQTQWMKYGKALEPMKDNYFSHEAYNDYPINNISYEGVKLYCKWLTEEYLKIFNKPINDIRIPTKQEWIYAARGGDKEIKYPWGGPYLRNSRGCFLANFKPGQIEKRGECEVSEKLGKSYSLDSLNNYVKTADGVIIPKEHKDLYSADGGFYTVKATSYNPNNFGLHCMSGNLAEITFDNSNNNIVAKGGSWNSIGYQLQIDVDNDYETPEKPNPEIGFRIVISYVDDKQTFVPFNTKKIDQNLFIDETEISNINWKEYLKWIELKYSKNSKEYKKALPDTTVWSSYLKNQYAYDKHYFSHPAYNNYPVVGITYEQAISFCKWRTDRVKEYAEKNQKELFPKNFAYRLPSKKEWELAASVGFDEKTIKKSKDLPIYNIKRDSSYFSSNTNRDNVDITAPVKSYWPNSLGIYNLTGNVAEMVQEKGIAKGGSWKHIEEECETNKDINYQNQSCWLGFRCVFEELK